MKKLRIRLSVTAADKNIDRCALIWYRPIVPSNANPQWNFTTGQFDPSGSTLMFSIEFNNDTLKDCDNFMVELLIIPCCDYVDSQVSCNYCSSIGILPYPSYIPSTAYHNFININKDALGAVVATSGINCYYVERNVYGNYNRIVISNIMTGCILGQDSSCTPHSMSSFVIYNVSAYSQALMFFAEPNATIIGIDAQNQQWPITPTMYRYNDIKGCYFDRWVYHLRNINYTQNYTIYYQSGIFPNKLESITIPPNSSETICAIKNTLLYPVNQWLLITPIASCS